MSRDRGAINSLMEDVFFIDQQKDYVMFKKCILSFVFLSTLLFAGSSAFATCNNSCVVRCNKGCLARTVVGSYVNTHDSIMTQFVFNKDGTAYFNQSTAIDKPITTGTFEPAIGSWEIINDRIVTTLVSTFAAPIVVDGIADVTPAVWLRLTVEFKILDDSTIQTAHRVVKEINLDKNPLTAPGTVLVDSFVKLDFTKVKVRLQDLK